ncbi:MAG: hypothetical protein COA43_11835 [Robiginitomaculum sp.]|nr:MAG: hypothetical protein COA43_11835 [Robiginitomaculum sp.]
MSARPPFFENILASISQGSIFDFLLIFISSLAVFYCWLLSRRLKALQSLESGLGASIVSLTDAITKTNRAALEAKQSTVETVQTLKGLLRSAEDAMPLVEARLESLRHSQRSAQNKHDELDAIMKKTVDPAIKNAKATSQSLLEIVQEIHKYEQKTKKKKG